VLVFLRYDQIPDKGILRGEEQFILAYNFRDFSPWSVDSFGFWQKEKVGHHMAARKK
jgi:hypothetical protein